MYTGPGKIELKFGASVPSVRNIMHLIESECGVKLKLSSKNDVYFPSIPWKKYTVEITGRVLTINYRHGMLDLPVELLALGYNRSGGVFTESSNRLISDASWHQYSDSEKKRFIVTSYYVSAVVLLIGIVSITVILALVLGFAYLVYKAALFAFWGL